MRLFVPEPGTIEYPQKPLEQALEWGFELLQRPMTGLHWILRG